MLSLDQLPPLLTTPKRTHFPSSTIEQVTSSYSLIHFKLTGKQYELKITDGAINATELGKIKDAEGEVTRSYDPAYMNTVSCISRISYIDGDKGILEYRGYPIE